jgi:hypothetical protein
MKSRLVAQIVASLFRGDLEDSMSLMLGPDDLSLARAQGKRLVGNDVRLARAGLYHFRHSRVDQNLEPPRLNCVQGELLVSTQN